MEQGEGLGEVFGPAQLTDEAEVCGVAGEGDDDVGHSDCVSLEACRGRKCDHDCGVWVGAKDTDADHGDDDSCSDGETSYDSLGDRAAKAQRRGTYKPPRRSMCSLMYEAW